MATAAAYASFTGQQTTRVERTIVDQRLQGGQTISRAPEIAIFTLSGPLSTEWTLQRPLSLHLEIDSSGYAVISDEVFLVYGDGENPALAFVDYKTALIEYCEMVRDDAGVDQPSADQYQELRAYIAPRAAAD